MSRYGLNPKFYIISEMTCKVLDIFDENPIPGVKVMMWPKKSNLAFNQLWYFDEQGVIRSALNDFAMEPEASGGMIKMVPYTGTAIQQWRMDENRIVNKVNNCLDICDGSNKDGAELISFKYKGQPNQHWRLQYV